MSGKDIIMVRQKDLKRLHIIQKVIEGALTQVQAAEILLLSERQVRRIVTRIREEGDSGIQHRSRGRESNRKTPKKVADRVIKLYRQKYKGFGPTLTSEKLFELDGIQLSKETVRVYLIGADEWKRGRKSQTHRQWRPGKEYFGAMVQIDGSHHDWFEGRGPSCVLMGYIDDATGKVFGRFYEYEGTIPAMDSFSRYIRKYGIPMSVYLDKHTTYKSPAKLSIEDEINGTEPLSEFGRAMKELSVELIHAHSPQAKGRVERLFRTLQDRLVKELRLRGIGTITEANKFLEYYLPIYNKKFARKAQKTDNLHRAIGKGVNLDKILCIKTERTVRNDNTIAHNKRMYQIEENVKAEKVIVEDKINGTMIITHKGSSLRFRNISERPEKEVKERLLDFRRKASYIPPADHPWKKFRPNSHIDKNRWKQAMADARV